VNKLKPIEKTSVHWLYS